MPGSTPATPATATACRMVEQRQIAERQRQAGNAAFKQQQYSEALRCYQAGLEVQRHSMALHANAAAAALKLSCYVQALEHCDKVCNACCDGSMLTGVQAQCFAGTSCIIPISVAMNVHCSLTLRCSPASSPCLLDLQTTELCPDDHWSQQFSVWQDSACLQRQFAWQAVWCPAVHASCEYSCCLPVCLPVCLICRLLGAALG